MAVQMSMMFCWRRLAIGAVVGAVFFGVAWTMAAEVAPAVTNASDGATALTGTITGVEGIVQVRDQDGQPWRAAKVGMVVGEGAEFRTGPRSAVQFTIPPDQTITLDRLGTVKLIEAIKSSNARIKTDLGMKYGRVRYDIEAAGEDHDSTIRSPGSALAVRGTRVSLYDQPPFPPQAISLTGAAQFRNARKQMIAFGSKGNKTTISADSSGAAQAALASSVLNSSVVQYTDQQLRELTFLFSHQGQVYGNVASSNVPVTNAQLPSLLGGNLDFVLRWDVPGSRTADLNIFVRTPLGEKFGNPPFILSLFPNDPKVGQFLQETFPQSTPSGGQVGLNSIGPKGIEIASLGADFPRGIYIVGAYNFIFSGNAGTPPSGTKVPFTLEAFLNGKRQLLITNFPAAQAGEEPPHFGFVFHDSIAIGQSSGTAVPVLAASGAGARSPGKETKTGVAAKPAPKSVREARPTVTMPVRAGR